MGEFFCKDPQNFEHPLSNSNGKNKSYWVKDINSQIKSTI